MVYGVGWVIATDRSVVRFIVITVALAITLGLGYVRFVVRGSRPAVGGVAPIPAAGLGDLEQRVRNLEVRVDEAASALGRSNK